MTINATPSSCCPLQAVAKRQGVSPGALSGRSKDILKEYVARGTYIYPPRPWLRIVTTSSAFCERELPRGTHLHQRVSHQRGRSTAVQEVAFTLAHATAYVQAAIDPVSK